MARIDDPALIAFGQWLTERTVQLRAELLATCANDSLELPTVKRKYGQFEAFNECLKHLTELYEDGLEKFKANYLEEEEPKE